MIVLNKSRFELKIDIKSFLTYAFSVGVMPADTIGGMSPNVWWIAAGSTKSSSTSARMDPAPGQILMVDMTKSNFSKFFCLVHYNLYCWFVLQLD